MLARTAEAAKMTLESTEMLHSPDAITDLIKLFTDFETATNQP
jgi:hypothetical protein